MPKKKQSEEENCKNKKRTKVESKMNNKLNKLQFDKLFQLKSTSKLIAKSKVCVCV